jgi:CBS domain-containing protein
MSFIDSFSKFSKSNSGVDEGQVLRKIIRNATTVSSSLSVEDAIEVLSKTGQSGVPVTNQKGELIGFFSEKDCLRYLYGAFYFNQLGSQVEKFMNQQVISIKESYGVSEILKLFIENPFHVYPVVDENNLLIGTINRTDLLREIYAIIDLMFEQSSAA